MWPIFVTNVATLSNWSQRPLSLGPNVPGLTYGRTHTTEGYYEEVSEESSGEGL